jgi:hypothetical protein
MSTYTWPTAHGHNMYKTVIDLIQLASVITAKQSYNVSMTTLIWHHWFLEHCIQVLRRNLSLKYAVWKTTSQELYCIYPNGLKIVNMRTLRRRLLQRAADTSVLLITTRGRHLSTTSVSDRPTFSGRHDFLPEKSGRHCEEIWKSFKKLQF